MDGAAPEHSANGFLARRYVELLTVLTVMFVAQAGVVPFDFQGEVGQKGSTGFFTTTVSHLTFPDTVANIFLYVPVGMLLHWSLFRTLRRRTLALPVTIALAGAMSAGIEWIQAYSPARISSIIDLVANTTGAALGSLMFRAGRGTVPKLLAAAIREAHAHPVVFLAKGYCVLLVFFACMPFSFSIDTLRLKKAVKSANFVPFRASTIDDSLIDDVLAEGDYTAYAHLKWRRMKRWSRWAAEGASFALLAWFLQAFLRRDYGFGRSVTMALIWWLGGGCAVGLSVLQLLVVSRACDVTDILFRLFGLGVGLIARFLWIRGRRSRTPALQTQRLLQLARAGCALTAGYILYTGIIPLTFDAGSAGPAASIASENLLPFFAYFKARFDVMMIDVMEKVASYTVFSALLAFYLTYRTGFARRPRVVSIVAAGVALSAPIEIVQMFISVRVTSLTDPILAAAGCLVGTYTQQHIAAFYRFTSPDAVRIPSDARQVTPRLSPSDALVATLTEPYADAPEEPSPARRFRTPG